jgi:hypothetical protein
VAEPVTIKTALLVSAATGCAVAAFRARGPWWARFATGCSGGAVSYFLTPIVAPLAELALERAVEWFWGVSLDLDAANVLGAVGFLPGVIGMELVQFAVDVIRGQRHPPHLRAGGWSPQAPCGPADAPAASKVRVRVAVPPISPPTPRNPT